MLHTILLPLDGSALAEEAIGPACRLARQAATDILLVRAVPAAAQAGSHAARSYLEAEHYLERVRLRLAGAGCAVRARVVHADPVRAITFTARIEGAGLIVMGTHGGTGLGRMLLGSVTQAVLEQIAVPLVLVRAGRGSPSPLPGGFQSILVPLEGSAEGEAGLAFLAQSGLERAAAVTLLSVVPAISPDLTPGMMNFDAAWKVEDAEQETGQKVQAMRQYLDSVADRYLKDQNPSRSVMVGPASAAIAEMVCAQAADLIVMATHHRSGVERVLHGSVAAEVLQQATVPVLVVRTAQREEANESQGAVERDSERQAAMAGTPQT